MLYHKIVYRKLYCQREDEILQSLEEFVKVGDSCDFQPFPFIVFPRLQVQVQRQQTML